MKHIELFEIFRRDYYEFNVADFLIKFREFFYIEKKKDEKMQSEFFQKLQKFILDREFRTMPLNETMNYLVREILEDKEIEFFSELIDDERYFPSDNIIIDKIKKEYFGRVKNARLEVKFLSGKDKYRLYIMLYDNNNKLLLADCNSPIKIYSKPTEFEKYIDLLSSANKFNL